MLNRSMAALATVGVGASLLPACGQDARVRTVAERTHAPGEAAARPPAAGPRRPAGRSPVTAPVDCARVKCVALTFDDGPGPHTARLLDHLAKGRARATFFVLGRQVRPNGKVVRRMAAEGHELANHTWSHPRLTGLSNTAIRSEVRRTQGAVHAVSGVRPRLFRPPYGATNARVGRAAAMPQIMWSVDTLDWRYRNASRTVRVVLRETRPGGIVLLHDIHAPSVAAVPRVLSGLERRGYRFVTVSELFAGRRLVPGREYWER